MADAAVTFLLENVTQLIISEAELLTDSKEEISWIKTEFRVMEAFLQSIDALHQLPESANDLADQTRKVVRKTEDLIETYVKKQKQLLRASAYLRPIGSVKLRNLRKKLRYIKDEIVHVRHGWKSVQYTANIRHLPGSSSQHSGSSAIDRLDTVLQKQYLDPALLECIKWLRDELAPLHDFLQQIANVQRLGERDKIWIQELKSIFQFINVAFFLRFGVQYFNLIQGKILQLYRRYYAYGFREILVDNGSRSIFPRIRPSRMPVKYLTLPTPEASIESLRVDLKLIKALLEDTRLMGDLDERAKVWLDQLKETAVDLEALDEHATEVTEGLKGVFHQLFSQRKIDTKLKQIAREISDITARKMTYGIGGALGDAGILNSIAAILLENHPHQMPVGRPFLDEILSNSDGQVIISKAELRRRVESVRKELELMNALFNDVNRMEKLDAGLKIWVEEMRRVALEANAVVGTDCKNFCTRTLAARRIQQVYHHIFMMSKWKHTYDIEDVKSSRTSVIDHDHHLVAAAPYPSIAICRELELWETEIKFIGTLYCDIEEKDNLDGTAKAWIEEMHNLITDATEWISRKAKHTYGSFSTRILHQERILSQYIEGFEKSSDLARMNDKMKQLSEIKVAYGIEPRRLPPSVVHEIKEKLLADQEQSWIIPILGMRHAHKEALQELINSDNAITHHFDWHSWVHAHEEFNGEYTERQIMEQVLMQMPQEILMHKRCLIVLDEIQSIEVWQGLERVFRRISTGSRIILFSNEHTFSLLNSSSQAIFNPVKLGGLPSETRELMPGSDAFNISSVPSYLRQCLFYFLLFPANFKVPMRRLIVLWASEGLVRRNKLESDEDIANRYLNELIKLNIVHGKTKKLNGKYKACQLNEDMRDTLSMRAKESRFFEDTTEKFSRLVDHHGTRTSDPCFISVHGNPIPSSLLKKYQSVLSFMSFNTREGNKPGEDLGNFLNKCIAAGCFLDLRTLDLEKVFRPKLPEAICDLILLRYLGLRWTYLEHLPKYVHKLLNLQVLDVKHTYISILPKSIWRMQYLRHLYLSETYRTKFDGLPSEVSLDELQTLWGAFIDEDTYVKKGLDTARNIRKLGLSCRSSSSSSEASPMSRQLKFVSNWISNLEHLETLRLKSRDEHGKASELHLEPLENKKLSTVYLLGKLDPVVVSRFPVNLIDITLSGSELNVDPMISLEKLEQLRILRLLSQSLSVECTSMRCSRGGFPQLKVLKIWKLENLEEWEVEEGALRSLEDLEIRSCEKLKILPDLQHVSTLRECMLTSMSEEFINQTKNRQPALGPKIKASS